MAEGVLNCRDPAVIAVPAGLQALIQAQTAAMNAVLAALPPPAPPAGVENPLIDVLKREVIASHLHQHMPITCSWRKKVHVLEPGFWLLVAINKPVALARLDITKDMDLHGDFVISFIEGGLYHHFPGLEQERKNQLVECFYDIMNYYLLHLPAVQAAMAAAPVNVATVRACAELLIKNCQSSFRRARTITLQLDTEAITAQHGPHSGALYSAMTADLNGDGHLEDSVALKQVNYHSRIGRDNRLVVDPNGAKMPKGSKCRRCQQPVPFAGFAAHNKICRGKGVRKPGGKRTPQDDGKPK